MRGALDECPLRSHIRTGTDRCVGSDGPDTSRWAPPLGTGQVDYRVAKTTQTCPQPPQRIRTQTPDWQNMIQKSPKNTHATHAVAASHPAPAPSRRGRGPASSRCRYRRAGPSRDISACSARHPRASSCPCGLRTVKKLEPNETLAKWKQRHNTTGTGTCPALSHSHSH